MNAPIKGGLPAALGLVFIGLLFLGLFASPDGWNASADQGGSSWGDDPSRRNDGPITFMLTPKGMEGGQFLVDIRVDTHTGDLKELNLKKQVRLKIDGRSYAPTGEVRLRGHHAGGTLVFPLQHAPKQFEIVILAVGSMGDVRFNWP